VWVGNDPVNGIDPDGGGLLDDYTMDEAGNITAYKKTDDNFDRILNEKGEEIYRTTEGYHFSFDISHLSGSVVKNFSVAVGAVESEYSIWESNYDHLKYPTTKGSMKTIYKPDGKFRSARAAQFAMYSKSVKGIGLGLSALNVGLGAYQMHQQMNNGEPVNPIDAVQLGVGTVGLFASTMNFIGIGGSAMSSIGASAGIFGMVLSIPSNWARVYQGAYDMQYQSTDYYPSDSEVFGGN
jgi:hypothetical protein